MADLQPATIGDAYANSQVLDVVERLVDIGSRMAGTPGEREAAEVMVGRFETLGLDVSSTSFTFPGWRRGETTLTVQTPRELEFTHRNEVIALPGTPEADLEGELVDVGYGLSEAFAKPNLEGKIVLVSNESPPDHDHSVHRRERYARAIDAGAIGFISRTGRDGGLPQTGHVGSVETSRIPAVAVSKEVGERLVRFCESDSPNCTLSIDCWNGSATSQNVEATLGPETDREVLVTAHADAHDITQGAWDNAAGCALVAEIARILSVESDLETRVRFVIFGAEEVGIHGSKQWVEANGLDGVKCMVLLDGIGNDRTLDVWSHGFDDAGGSVREACNQLDLPMESRALIRPYSDAWSFAQHGTPSLWFRSKTDQPKGLWAHTFADTVDKLDHRDLRDLAITASAAVARLCDRENDYERQSPEDISERLPDGIEDELRLTHRWPWPDE